MSDHLVGTAEAARILGVSRLRLVELVQEGNFPVEEVVLQSGRIWRREAVEAWAAKRPEPSAGTRTGAARYRQNFQMSAQVARVHGLANREARELGHLVVTLDHLFLGLLHPECPGDAGSVLRSLGLTLEGLRSALMESFGDPFEAPAHQVTTPAGVLVMLERANVKRVQLQDNETRSEHLLLALVDEWRQTLATAWLADGGLSSDVVYERVFAITERAESDLVTPMSLPVRPKGLQPPEGLPELASTSKGHPLRRRPWGSAVFHDVEGRPVTRGKALLQYFIDRDGNPVVTTDGRPVHVLMDDTGYPVLDGLGNPKIIAVDVPPNSVLRPRTKVPS